jgi:hypothetical protein
MATSVFAIILVSFFLFSTSFARQPHESTTAKPPSSLHLNIAQPPIIISQENALHKHRNFDKSKTGGEIIIAGLAVVALAAIVCYIRVTRQNTVEGKLPISV